MKVIRLGIFGLGRGGGFYKDIMANNGEVVAVCDRREECFEEAKKYAPNVACYTDFDAFLEHDMDAVFLANCFHEHTPFAIRCLEKGLHVLSECTSNATMAEGVALVRAAEKSKAFYMLAENYPYMRFNQEMRRVYREGSLGKAVYAEGEYNHPFNMDDEETHKGLRPYPEHWRNFLPRSYYITHSLAPLMYITGAAPKRVTALGCFAPFEEFERVGSPVADRAAIITTLNDDDSVFRVTGCAAFGAHGLAYRVCGTLGSIEKRRGGKDNVLLRYNSWNTPKGAEQSQEYLPEWPEEVRELAEKAGHGGGDFFEIREFFNCIRENRRPEFDEYFATTCASVGILAHRSLMEQGMPYDIPDFRKEEDCKKYENDHLCPLPRAGLPANQPCCSHPDYEIDPVKYGNYIKMVSKK